MPRSGVVMLFAGGSVELRDKSCVLQSASYDDTLASIEDNHHTCLVCGTGDVMEDLRREGRSQGGGGRREEGTHLLMN
jgi:hypothetical protein